MPVFLPFINFTSKILTFPNTKETLFLKRNKKSLNFKSLLRISLIFNPSTLAIFRLNFLMYKIYKKKNGFLILTIPLFQSLLQKDKALMHSHTLFVHNCLINFSQLNLRPSKGIVSKEIKLYWLLSIRYSLMHLLRVQILIM